MIFKQLFGTKSSTYTYIISSGKGREALIIDPVIEHTDEYINILEKLKLKLVKVIDTHIHADHITGLNELNKRTSCTRIMGENSRSEVIDIKILVLEVGDVTDFQISFNPNYLIQGIEVLDGNKAFLRFSGNDKPAVIQGEEETYQYLLMPVRTNE